MSEKETGMKSEELTTSIMSLLIGLPLSVLARGYAIVYLWLWFAVPLGVPAMGFWQATGLATLAFFVTFSSADEVAANELAEKPYWKRAIFSVCLSLTALVAGAFYHWLMSF